MIDFEKLTGLSLPDDLPPPPQPAVKATQDALATKLRAAASFLTLMAEQVEQRPFSDHHFDRWNLWLGRVLAEAGDALVGFRATRDCGGQS